MNNINPEKCRVCSKEFGKDENGLYIINVRTGGKRVYISVNELKYLWGPLNSCSDPASAGELPKSGCGILNLSKKT